MPLNRRSQQFSAGIRYYDKARLAMGFTGHAETLQTSAKGH
ncbi:hypothetical protein SAMN05216210_2062 [Halopseudomonas salegens]|uniref:Uncharacterized protein n=1 Tax=Halopseudomonas salegens TaxID=1434072 RepID=A0A1H2G5L9_9GAMM|nr:hypothetical protein SAMN05216210_2062 [Halopseudomonas salegens]